VDSLHGALDRIFAKFVQAHLSSEAARKKAEAEENELIKHKLQTHTFETDEEREERVMREHFPNYLHEFDDIAQSAYSDMDTATHFRSTMNEEVQLGQTIDRDTVLELVRCHMQYALRLGHDKPHTLPSAELDLFARVQSLSDCLQEATLFLKYSSEGLRALRTSSPQICTRGGSLLALACAHGVRHFVAQKDLQCALLAHEARLSFIALEAVDRDLMYMLDRHKLGSWHVASFHNDPCVTEVVAVLPALEHIFTRAAALLTQFPDNELLLQVCKVASRIARYSTHTPLGKLLTSVEYLVKKAQDWEQFAHSGVSLAGSIAMLTSRVAQWRKLELDSWTVLLRCSEQKAADRALHLWFTFFRVLNSQLKTVALQIPPPAAVATISWRWPLLNSILPPWLAQTLHSATPSLTVAFEGSEDVAAQVSELESAGHKYLVSIFDIIDNLLRTSSVGEFAARLHLLKLYVTDILHHSRGPHVYAQGSKSVNFRRSIRRRLGVALYGLWRFYEQYLSDVRVIQEHTCKAVTSKLKDQVRISKWDDMTYHALMTTVERTHKQLIKYLKEYESGILAGEASLILRNVMTRDFVSSSGKLEPSFEVPAGATIAPHLDVSPVGVQLLHAPSSLLTPSEALKRLRQHATIVLPAAWKERVSQQNTEIPKRLVNVEKVTRRLDRLLSSNLLLEPVKATEQRVQGKLEPSDTTSAAGRAALQLSDECEAVCAAIFDRIEALRAREGVTRAVKLRAVVDLIKGLKARGVSHLYADTPASCRDMVECLSVEGPFIERIASDIAFQGGLQGVKAAHSTLDQAERYFYRGLAELRELRTQKGCAFHCDVSARDAHVWVAQCDFLFFKLLALRGLCAVAVREHERARLQLRNLLGLCRGTKTQQRIGSGAALHNEERMWTPQRLMEDFVCAHRVAVVCMLDGIAHIRTLLTTSANATTVAHHTPRNSHSEAILACNAKLLRLYADLFASLQRLNTAHDVLSVALKCSPHALPAHYFELGQAIKGSKHSSSCEVVYANAQLDTLLLVGESVATIQPKLLALLNDCEAHIVRDALLDLRTSMQSVSSSANASYTNLLTWFDAWKDGNIPPSSVAVDTESTLAISTLCGKVIDRVCMSVQAVVKFPVGTDARDTSHLEVPNLAELHRKLSEAFHGFKLPRLTAALRALSAALIELQDGGYSDSRPVLTSKYVAAVYTGCDLAMACVPAVERAVCIHALFLEDTISALKSLGKLLYVCVRVYRTLLAKGVCSDESQTAEDGGESGDISQMVFEDAEGVGMGDGDVSQAKDVSKEIEDEEQLMDLKRTDEDDEVKNEEKKLNAEEKDTGVEMSQNFDGEMYDIEKNENDAEEDQDDDENDAEELDREMGGDLQEDDIVDEKMWDGDDDAKTQEVIQ
jgi:hypothetical protein